MALEDAKRQVDHAFTRDALRGATFENAFGGALRRSRGGAIPRTSAADLAITGIPFDQKR